MKSSKPASTVLCEMIASGEPLNDTLTTLVDVIEAESDGMLASIIMLDARTKTLRTAAAPACPMPTTAWSTGSFPAREPDRAAPRRSSAKRFSSKTSSPIPCGPTTATSPPTSVFEPAGRRRFSPTTGACFGTFALYYKQPRSPNQKQLELIQRATHIAGIAIERKQMEEQLQALNARIERVREEERTGIAREIHDELGQGLTGLEMDVAWVGRRLSSGESLSPDNLRERMNAMSDLIDETINQVRRISAELGRGVLNHLGLLAAIEWQAQESRSERAPGAPSRRTSASRSSTTCRPVSFAFSRRPSPTLARRAEAKKVSVKLNCTGDRLELDIHDDGKGISEEAARAPPRSACSG